MTSAITPAITESTSRPQVDAPLDEDLAEQARAGHGVPSQDPSAGAQFALEPEEARREAQSVYAGGGVLAGVAAGAAIGAAVAGPVGVLVGGTVGSVAGALGGAAAGAAAGAAVTPDSPQAPGVTGRQEDDS